MDNNIGLTDRFIRALIGVLLGAYYFTGYTDGYLGAISLFIGSVLVLTSLFAVCPIYKIMGIKTHNKG